MDERIEKLGVYFIHHKVRERLGLTFEEFVYKVDNDTWRGFP